MNRIQKITAAVLLLALLACGIGLFGATHIRVDGRYDAKSAASLDVRRARLTPAQYENLKAALPDCEIVWDLPFQGGFLPLDTQELTITSLTQSEAESLDYLPDLLEINAQGCRDYEALLFLTRRRPQIVIRYDLEFGSIQADRYQTTLEVTDGKLSEILQAMAHMPKLSRIVFSGTLPEETALDAVRQAKPKAHLFFHLGKRDFPLSKGSTTVDARKLGLSEEDLREASQRNPQLTILWEMEILGNTFRTDAEELDFSDQEIPDPSPIEEVLPYFHNLKKVVMCRCGLDSERMDALNQRHEDVRFVWEVQLGPVALRTDADVFAPVKTWSYVTTEDLDDLKYCTDLICIDLGHNYITDISWAAYMPDLTYVVLADGPLDDISPLANHTKLKFLELFLTPVTDFSPLLTCTGLEDLNLSYCLGNPAPIYEMKWLKHLWWANFGQIIDDDGNEYRQVIQSKLPDTDVEWWHGSSTGGEWRHLDNYFAMRDVMGMWYLFG